MRNSWLTLATKSERIRSRRRMVDTSPTRRIAPGPPAADGRRADVEEALGRAVPDDLGLVRLALREGGPDEGQELRVAHQVVDGPALHLVVGAHAEEDARRAVQEPDVLPRVDREDALDDAVEHRREAGALGADAVDVGLEPLGHGVEGGREATEEVGPAHGDPRREVAVLEARERRRHAPDARRGRRRGAARRRARRRSVATSARAARERASRRRSSASTSFASSAARAIAFVPGIRTAA